MMYWTKKKPDQAGYFWCKPDEDGRPIQVARVYRKGNTLYANAEGFRNCSIESLDDYHWSSEPLVVPEVPDPEVRAAAFEFQEKLNSIGVYDNDPPKEQREEASL